MRAVSAAQLSKVPPAVRPSAPALNKIRGDQGHDVGGQSITPQSKVIRAILLENSPQSEVIRAIMMEGSPLNKNPR